MRRLEGRVALVTGGGSGIGRATALRLASEGAAVGIATLGAGESESVLAECLALGATASTATGDLGDPEFVKTAHRQLTEELGAANVIVNNVGIAINASLLDSGDDVYEKIMSVNFMAAVRFTRLALPSMLERGAGCIINIGSAQAIYGWPGYSAYSAAKGAMMSWSRQLANELGTSGIRSNTVIPGATMTPMNQARIVAEGTDVAQRSTNLHIIPRFGLPEEVAAAVAYLASDDAAFVTATELYVDGGTTAKAHWYA